MCGSGHAGERIVVFAAASMKDALEAIGDDWQARGGKQIAVSPGSSALLAKQIMQGAPADIFISANEEWMDELAGQNLIEPKSRFDVAGNTLVLVGKAREAADQEIDGAFPLASMLADGRLAMGMTDSVPAGIYGRQALVSLKLWDSVKDRLAETDNVRAALALVASGDAPLGIVYGSDAKADSRVSVLGLFPPSSHDPIVYPVAVVTGRLDADVTGFIDFLKSKEALAILEAHGFAAPPGAAR